MVFVLHKNGNFLMPTKNHAKVRVLLKDKRAKVVQTDPFTIQLLYDTSEYLQELPQELKDLKRNLNINTTTNKVWTAAEMIKIQKFRDHLQNNKFF
ncbi:MAG: RRXRR domain-containing protein [Desulfovibrionaceae bacterium]|nr:RRXRR domain-containing protein [Desulfovibrionaceae bacterium]